MLPTDAARHASADTKSRPATPQGWGHRRQGSADGSTARGSQKNARAPRDEPLATGEPACQASCHGAWPEIPLRAREQGGSRKRAVERLSHGGTEWGIPGRDGSGASQLGSSSRCSPPPLPCVQAAAGHVPGAFLPDRLQLQTETWDQPLAVTLLGTACESVTAGFPSLNPPEITLLSLGLPRHEKHPAAVSTSVPGGTRDDPQASEDSWDTGSPGRAIRV